MGSTRLVSRRRQDPGAKWARIAMAVPVSYTHLTLPTKA